MRPRLQRHPALRHRPEHLSERPSALYSACVRTLPPTFIQYAIPAPAVPKIQSHRVFLLRKGSRRLLACHSDILRHSRSPYLLRLERVITGSLSHPAWRPAFSSHLISPVTIAPLRDSGSCKCFSSGPDALPRTLYVWPRFDNQMQYCRCHAAIL
jgi:hypothetical protein